MSDIVTEQPAAEEIDESVDTSGSETGTVEEAPAFQDLDLDEYGDFVVPVKVNGEESKVALRELQQGYQRQQDYTLKTQEVATQREALAQAQALQEALDENPQQTLAILTAVYGKDAAEEMVDEDLDPQEARLREMESRFAAQDEASQKAAVMQELDDLNERYGVDREALLQFAVDSKIDNLGHARAVMAQAEADAKAEFEAAEKAKEDGRTAEKRDASFVTGGTSSAPSSSTAALPKNAGIRELYHAAEAALGR